MTIMWVIVVGIIFCLKKQFYYSLEQHFPMIVREIKSETLVQLILYIHIIIMILKLIIQKLNYYQSQNKIFTQI